jgi:hypothetical protein
MEIRYRVDFYDSSITDGTVVNSFEVPMAPYAFSVGDFVDPSGWGGKNPLSPDKHYQIVAVEHQVSLVDTPEASAGQHNIAITMKAVKKRFRR